MNQHELNTTALNTDGAVFTLSNIGEVRTDLTFYVFEENGMPMHADVSIDFASSADLARIIQIGKVTTGITAETTAELMEDPTAYIGAVQASITTSTTGTMNTRLVLGATALSLALASTASLTRRRTMSGSTGITLSASAVLTRFAYNFLPNVTTGIDFSGSASLRNYANIGAGQTGVSFATTGLLAGMVYLHGQTGIAFDVHGNLFNNPAGDDVDTYVMRRPYTNREMVRRK